MILKKASKILAVISLLLIMANEAASQITMTTAPTVYQFFTSKDQNLHPGFNARFGYDYDLLQFDLGFSYYLPVTTNINTLAYEIHPSNPLFPAVLPIINSVVGNSFETSFQINYFINGQPIGGKGIQTYGFLGTSLFVYQQENNLSFFNTQDYAAKVIDHAQSTYSQITFDFGAGIKYPLRNKSLFAEARIALPTDLEKDYGMPVQTTAYYSVTAGIRWHLVTRKNIYQQMANRKRKPNLR